MGNTFTSYNFDTAGKFVSGIARIGTKENSNIIGFYVSNFGQKSEYLYQARIVKLDNSDTNSNNYIPDKNLNVFFPSGWFLSGVDHYQKSTQGSNVEEEQIHYIITDGYSKKVGYIHYGKHNIFGYVPSTVENSNQFSCTTGEYLTEQNQTINISNKIRTVTYDYKCSAGKPRPIHSSDVGAAGPIGPRGWHGIPGSTGLRGLQGVSGERGLLGNRGGIGLTGSRGLIGETGVMGQQGKQGLSGARGLSGSTGFRGPMGIPGPVGKRGLKGGQGKIGIKGDVGAKGKIGPRGNECVIKNNKRIKYQLNTTTILMFILIIYLIISKFTVKGNVVDNTSTLNKIIKGGGKTAGSSVAVAGNILGGMISTTGGMLGGMISDASGMLGGALAETSNMLGDALVGTTSVIGGAIDGALVGTTSVDGNTYDLY
jgi:hypothetical protein